MGNRNEYIIKLPIWLPIVFLAICVSLSLLGHRAVSQHGLIEALQVRGVTGKIAFATVVMHVLTLLSFWMLFSPRKVIVGPTGVTEKIPGKTISVGWDRILSLRKAKMGVVLQTDENEIVIAQGMFVADKVLSAARSFKGKTLPKKFGRVDTRPNRAQQSFGMKA